MVQTRGFLVKTPYFSITLAKIAVVAGSALISDPYNNPSAVGAALVGVHVVRDLQVHQIWIRGSFALRAKALAGLEVLEPGLFYLVLALDTGKSREVEDPLADLVAQRKPPGLQVVVFREDLHLAAAWHHQVDDRVELVGLLGVFLYVRNDDVVRDFRPELYAVA